MYSPSTSPSHLWLEPWVSMSQIVDRPPSARPEAKAMVSPSGDPGRGEVLRGMVGPCSQVCSIALSSSMSAGQEKIAPWPALRRRASTLQMSGSSSTEC